jgi:glycosyltransferase involved in cell wall biosynthesis
MHVNHPSVERLFEPFFGLCMLLLLFFRYGRGRGLVLWSEMTNSILPFLPYKRAFGVPLIVDMHGTAPDELLLSRPPGPERDKYYDRLSRRERMILGSAQGLVAVSERMLSVNLEKYRSLPPCTRVVPNSPEEKLFNWSEAAYARTRAELGLAGNFVMVYSGGTQAWQSVPETLEFFAKARLDAGLADLKPVLLFLTWDLSFSLKDSLGKLGLSTGDVRLINAPAAEVPRYLQAADAGLLFRKNAVTNLVSCPTKAGEYLMSGLPVVCTPYAGDVAGIVTAADSGYVTEFGGYEGERFRLWCGMVRSRRAEIAARCVKAGHDGFGSHLLARLTSLADEVAGADRRGRE